MLYRGENLPFTLDGMTPDIILNPHAIPSRMTMAQILESVKSKYGCYAGLQDGSPFNRDTAEDLQEMLHSMGFRGDGTQVMQCGVTGERFRVPIFIGPTFYQVSLCYLILICLTCTNPCFNFYFQSVSSTIRRKNSTLGGAVARTFSLANPTRGAPMAGGFAWEKVSFFVLSCVVV